MFAKLLKLSLVFMILACTSCVVEPYDPGPAYPAAYPAPVYGYGYGYGPVYPWYGGIGIDISRGYGHGGYYRGGGRGGFRGGRR